MNFKSQRNIRGWQHKQVQNSSNGTQKQAIKSSKCKSAAFTVLPLFPHCGSWRTEETPSPCLSRPPAQSPETGWRKNRVPAPFAGNYGSCLNLPTLKQEQRNPGCWPANADRQTDTDPLWISELWSEAKHGFNCPFSHTRKRHFSCMNTGFMSSSYFQIFNIFLFPKGVFNRVLSLYFHHKMTTKQKDNKELIILKKYCTIPLFYLFIYFTICSISL